MKQIAAVIAVITFSSLTSMAQQLKPFVTVEAGYVSDHYAQFSMYGGVETYNEDRHFSCFVEAGGKFQLTLDQRADITGINAGITYTNKKFFASIKAGPAIGFNRPMIDEYKPDPSTVIVLSPGYATSTFISPLIGVKAGYKISDVPMYVDVTYAGKMMWYGMGVKIIFGNRSEEY